MGRKTHKTAIVLIPPPAVQEPIQEIRRLHDRQVRRWMPHITLVYPFRPRGEFDELSGPLREATGRIEPFTVTLSRFRFFRHGRWSFTLWLDPVPREPFLRLEEALTGVVPDLGEGSRNARGFAPHLSVGQVRGRDAPRRARELREELESRWCPVEFVADGVCLIARDDPPDDVFRVAREVGLGRS